MRLCSVFGNISFCPVRAADLLFSFVIFFCSFFFFWYLFFFHPVLCLLLSCSLSAVKRLQRVGQSYSGEQKSPWSFSAVWRLCFEIQQSKLDNKAALEKKKHLVSQRCIFFPHIIFYLLLSVFCLLYSFCLLCLLLERSVPLFTSNLIDDVIPPSNFHSRTLACMLKLFENRLFRYKHHTTSAYMISCPPFMIILFKVHPVKN